MLEISFATVIRLVEEKIDKIGLEKILLCDVQKKIYPEIEQSGILVAKYAMKFAKDNNISGLEFMSCIPGSIGGGIRMNSGCFNREFKDILISIQIVDFKGIVRSIPAHKIKFNYRSIELPHDLIFLRILLNHPI